MWYSCERWSLLAAELSRSSKASWEPSIRLSSGCNRVVITQTWTQSGPVNKCILHNVVITTLAKLRRAPAYAPLGFVQPQQNLSKLNYEAICHIFDVIKIEAPAGMYIDQRVRKQPPMFGHYVSKNPRSLKVLHSESGGFPIWADYTSVVTKVMTIEERRRMLTGDNLRKRTAGKAGKHGCTCVLWLGKCSLYKEGAVINNIYLGRYLLHEFCFQELLFFDPSVLLYFPFFLFIFEKKMAHFFSRCVWINSTAPSVSSLVWALQLRSYLELN